MYDDHKEAFEALAGLVNALDRCMVHGMPPGADRRMDSFLEALDRAKRLVDSIEPARMR
jgi:hypothetical protein